MLQFIRLNANVLKTLRKLQIIVYNPNYKTVWDNFVASSNTPILLFYRNFMDYHQHRFIDNSLLIFENKELIALFPANKNIENSHSQNLYSHQGLTFGGLLTKPKTSFEIKEKIISELLIYAKNNNFKNLIIKQLPNFLQIIPDEVEHYFWQANHAIQMTVDINSVLDLRKPFNWQKRKCRNIAKAKQNNITISKVYKISQLLDNQDDYREFWNLLTQNLQSRFGINPVHSLVEIMELVNNFSNKISLYVAKMDNQIIAGTLLFDYGNSVHAQYIAANEVGKNLGATDLLFSEILSEMAKNYTYFSFGISNTRKDYEINQGLLAWKQGWGAEIYLHRCYKVVID